MAMMGKWDAFLSVWGGKANVEQIQKARDGMANTKGKRVIYERLTYDFHSYFLQLISRAKLGL